METNIFIREIFSTKWPKLESVENIVRKYFFQCLVFNKTIIPLTLVGYELNDSRLGASHLVRYLKAHIQRAFVE